MSVLLVEETEIPCENPSPWPWFELTTFKWLIIKGVARSRNSKKDMQYNGNTKKDKRQTAIYKTLPLSLKTEQHEPLRLRWLTRVFLKGKQTHTY